MQENPSDNRDARPGQPGDFPGLGSPRAPAEANTRGEPPLERFLRIASDPTPTGAAYRPTPAACKLAEKIWDYGAESFTVLAEAAGISRRALYDILDDKDAVKWIVSHGTKAAAAGLGLVHARLLNLALTSRDPAALRLYLSRFDPHFAENQSHVTVGEMKVDKMVALVQGMSDDELQAYLRQRRRQLLGDNDAQPESGREAG